MGGAGSSASRFAGIRQAVGLRAKRSGAVDGVDPIEPIDLIDRVDQRSGANERKWLWGRLIQSREGIVIDARDTSGKVSPMKWEQHGKMLLQADRVRIMGARRLSAPS